MEEQKQVAGSTGITFAGSMEFIDQMKPMFVFLENVPTLVKSPNMAWLLKRLEAAGYTWAFKVDSSLDYALPQDRRRVWLHAKRKDMFGDKWQAKYRRAMDSMKLQNQIVPLERLLIPDHQFPLQLKEGKQKAEGKKKAEGKAKAKGKRIKWANDHRVVRRRHGVAPRSQQLPAEVDKMAKLNCLSDREADILNVVHQSGVSLAEMSKTTATLELNHSLPRTENMIWKSSKGTQRRPRHYTSTLLPGSRLLVLGKRGEPRLLRGAEALALQGIPLKVACELHDQWISNSTQMLLAGDAFSGALVMTTWLAALCAADFGMKGRLDVFGAFVHEQ